MSKGAALLLVLVFVAASTIFTNPVLSSNEANENTWVTKASMPAARSALVAVVDGKIYAIGGDAFGTNEMYDPTTDNWTTKAPMPTPRGNFGIAVYQGKIYCMGGKNSRANEVYDPSTDTWETKMPMPTARWRLEANVANGKIYLMGGEPNQTINEAYDPVANSWTTKSPIPFIETEGYHRSDIYAASAAIDNSIYWIGVVGYYDGEGLRVLNQMYSTENDSWSLRASPLYSLPSAAGLITGEWAPERIDVIGLGTNFAYDPLSDRWQGGNAMFPVRDEFGVAVVNDTLYVIGGKYLYSSSADNEQYIPFGYGTPGSSYLLENAPPKISFLSPLNQTFNESSFSINFTINKPIEWVGYSLDGKDNVTINGNTTLTGLPNGLHNLTVYANDTFGNVGASETVTFTVVVPFPTATVAVVSGVVAIVVVAGLLVYFKKRKSLKMHS